MTGEAPTAMAATTVVLHPLGQPGVREALEAVRGIRLVCAATEDDTRDALRSGAVLVTVNGCWRDEFFQPGLRWVQSQSAGYEGFPVDEFRRRGIILASARGLHVVCAEHAIALLLCLTRDLHLALRDMAGRRWNLHVAEELGGRTVVIAGLGAIGEAIARRLSTWEVRLIGVTRSPKRYAGVLGDVRPLAELASACAEASVLIVSVPAAPETRHLVSAPVLDSLGAGWVVNVARGSVVDEAALVERLRDGRLLGAGLDVVELEPLPGDSPLWVLPNVVITPHMAGHSPRYGERLAELFTHNLRAYQGLVPWRNRIC